VTSVVFFDVNETLLDLSPLRSVLAGSVAEVSVGEWFARLLHRSLVANQLAEQTTFEALGRETLVWLAARRGVDLDPDEAERAVGHLGELPAHPDVVAGLEALAGRARLMALTNSSAGLAVRQLHNAGLAGYFDEILSVEAVGRFKPAPEVYRHAAAVGGVPLGSAMLVAAHDWDVAGAQAAGMVGCFLRRGPWGLEAFAPHHTIESLTELPAILETEWTR
jgi:2-haloacid dehalogenase